MNPSDTYTVTFDSDVTLRVREMARKLGKSPSGLVAEALALLETVQGKEIVLKDNRSGNAIEIKKYAK